MKQNRCLLMDESDAPYEINALPYPRTIQDDLFLLKLVEMYDLELKPGSHLANVEKAKKFLAQS